jgi:beta-N-acetylhexosaminidase
MQHRALELARRTITLVRDDERALPIPTDLGDRLVVVSFIASAATKMETWTTTPNELGMQTAARAKGALDIQIADPAAGATRERILRAAERAAVVVVATLNAVLDPSQVSLLEAIRDRSRAKIVVVATRMPYDLVRMPWARTFVAAYTSVAPVMAATSEVLFGERRAPGRLPVAIPGLYPRGHRVS